MTETNTAMIHAALVEAALRLVDNHPDIAAGSVLQCYSRAVRLMRRARTPASQLPARAEVLAGQLLSARNRPGAQRVRASRRDSGPRPTLYPGSA